MGNKEKEVIERFITLCAKADKEIRRPLVIKGKKK